MSLSSSPLTKSDGKKIIISAYAQNKKKVEVKFIGKGRTKQSYKDECDINNIMARFVRTGVLEFTNKNQARYGDCTGLEYQEAVLKVAAAKSLFAELPSELRARFENEPGRLLEFIQNPRNREEARELGLLKPEEPTSEAQATPPAPPHGATAPAGAGSPAKGGGKGRQAPPSSEEE